MGGRGVEEGVIAKDYIDAFGWSPHNVDGGCARMVWRPCKS